MPGEFRGFERGALEFLEDLAANNNRAWFDANRRRYEELLLAPLRALVADLAPFMASIDPGFDLSPRVGRAISRIHRDTRFSKDKSPYRDCVWLVFWDRRVPERERAGFFFEAKPRSHRWGMGFYAASRSRMDAVRAQIDTDPVGFMRLVGPLLAGGRFELVGDFYKRSLGPHLPREVREWYDRKSFHLETRGAHPETLAGDHLVTRLMADFEALAPLYRFISRSG